ncbi:zinc-finger domain-containing protein [Bacillus thuringiensis]
MGYMQSAFRKRCHIQYNKDNDYTEGIGIMNKRETRIRILDLQDQHCMGCKHYNGVRTYCMDDCKIGKELYQLGTGLIGDEKDQKRKVKMKWDSVCQQALVLRSKGYTYQKIATQLGCHASSLRKQLHQRGL